MKKKIILKKKVIQINFILTKFVVNIYIYIYLYTEEDIEIIDDSEEEETETAPEVSSTVSSDTVVSPIPITHVDPIRREMEPGQAPAQTPDGLDISQHITDEEFEQLDREHEALAIAEAAIAEADAVEDELRKQREAAERNAALEAEIAANQQEELLVADVEEASNDASSLLDDNVQEVVEEADEEEEEGEIAEDDEQQRFEEEEAERIAIREIRAHAVSDGIRPPVSLPSSSVEINVSSPSGSNARQPNLRLHFEVCNNYNICSHRQLVY